jgi:hypothetical protein
LLALAVFASAGCSSGKIGRSDPADARERMTQQSAVVVGTSTVGDEQTFRFLLPSGARVEVSYPEPATNGKAVHTVSWLTSDPNAEDRSLVEACFPTG